MLFESEISEIIDYYFDMNVVSNSKITDESWILIGSAVKSDYSIDDDKLRLIKLNANNNPKIKNVSQILTLKELNIGWDCGVNDEGIYGLQLMKLDVCC